MSSGASFVPMLLPGTTRDELGAREAAARDSDPPSFESLPGTLATQEYIQALIKHDPSNVSRILTLPSGHDPSVWLYEHLRQFLLELNGLLVRLGDVCTSSSCPKMCATENWMFLCAAHGKAPRECSAVDYSLHTVVGFASMLNANDAFPTRYTISAKSAQQFGNIARRLYRVFAHAFYHHRSTFDEIESRTHLTKRFIQFSLQYELIPSAQLTPPIDI